MTKKGISETMFPLIVLMHLPNRRENMKINRILLNCRRDTSLGGEMGADPVLLFFRTPVAYNEGNSVRQTTKPSVALMTSGYKQSFRPVNGKTLRYDLVSFRTSAADRQYISSMNIIQDIPVELNDDFIISATLRSMRSQSIDRGKHFSEFMELSMRIIFIALSDISDSCNDDPNLKIPRYAELRKLRDAVYDDPSAGWSVEEMCEDMQISKTYFHRLYLEAFGVTFRQDIIESRLIHAAELLKNTDLSVTAISETCGYDSESYFMRQFKQHRGCTPSEYRRKVRNTD